MRWPLWIAFGQAPPAGPIDGCTYCYAPEDLEHLAGDPAQVPDELVGYFAREGIDHWREDQYPTLWRGLASRIIRLAINQRYDPGLMLRGIAAPHVTSDSKWRAFLRNALG